MYVINQRGKIIGYIDRREPKVIKLIHNDRPIEMKKEHLDQIIDHFFKFKHKNTGEWEQISVKTVINEGMLLNGIYIYQL